MKKQSTFILIIAVFSLIFVTATGNVLNPVLADFATLYPEVNPNLISQVNSIPALMYILTAFIAPVFTKKFGYRKTIIVGSCLVVVFGMLPALINSFPVVLICRIVYGFGFGLVNVLALSLLCRVFKGDLQARLVGYQNGIGTLLDSGLVIVSGYAAVASTRAPYLVYGVSIITLLCAIFILKEPEKDPEELSETVLSAEEKRQARKGIPASVIILIIIMICRSLPMITVMYNTSTLVYELGLGDSSTAGLISSTLSIGTLSAGFLFVYMNRLFKKYTLSIGLCIEMCGGFLMSFGKTVNAFIAAYIMMGFGMIVFVNALAVMVTEMTPAASYDSAMGLMRGLPYLSNFTSTYYTIMLMNIMPNYTTQKMFIVGACLQGIMLIISVIIVIRYTRSKKQLSEA